MGTRREDWRVTGVRLCLGEGQGSQDMCVRRVNLMFPDHVERGRVTGVCCPVLHAHATLVTGRDSSAGCGLRCTVVAWVERAAGKGSCSVEFLRVFDMKVLKWRCTAGGVDCGVCAVDERVENRTVKTQTLRLYPCSIHL